MKGKVELVKVVDEHGKVLDIKVGEEDILRSYRGRPGCMCGCRGTYSDKKSLGIRRLRKIRELCNSYNELPRMLYGLDGERIIHLPAELERKLNVNYTVYLR